MRTISRRSFNRVFVSAAAVFSGRKRHGRWQGDKGCPPALGRDLRRRLGQLAYEGIKELAGKGGFKTAYAENISQAQIPQVARGYADDGYDLIIGHGFEFGSPLLEIAPDYPKIKFFVSTFQPQPLPTISSS